MKIIKLLTAVLIVATNLHASPATRHDADIGADANLTNLQTLYSQRQYDTFINQLETFRRENWGATNAVQVISLAVTGLVECDRVAAATQNSIASQKQTLDGQIKAAQATLKRGTQSSHFKSSGGSGLGMSSNFDERNKATARDNQSAAYKKSMELDGQAASLATIRNRLSQLYKQFDVTSVARIQRSIEVAQQAETVLDDGNISKAIELSAAALSQWEDNKLAKEVNTEARAIRSNTLFKAAQQAYDSGKTVTALELANESLENNNFNKAAQTLRDYINTQQLIRGLTPWAAGLALLIALCYGLRILERKFC